jgi:hypothetical protein
LTHASHVVGSSERVFILVPPQSYLVGIGNE